MLDLLTSLIESAPTWAVGIFYVAVVRVLVSFAVMLSLRHPLKERVARFARAKERSEKLDLGTSQADFEVRRRIQREEGAGCIFLPTVVGGMLLFGITMFAAVWAVMAGGPPIFAESAGWLGVALAFAEQAIAFLLVFLRSPEHREALGRGPGFGWAVVVLCGWVIPFAIVYAIAPLGAVVYTVTVFVLGQTLSRALWRMIDGGRAPAFVGFI